jgi:hypothetical protein
VLVLLLGLAALAGLPAGSARAQWGGSLEPRVPAARCLSPAGTLFALDNVGRAWQPVKAEGAVMSRDLLLALPGTQAELEPRPQSLGVTLWGNLTDPSFPGLESALVLHDSRAMDLDVTLVRGRVVLTNRKAKGAAEVWVRLRGEAWQLSLPGPGTRVAVQTYGRWPQGTTFTRETGPEGVPQQVVEVVVLKGSLGLKTGSQDFHMAAAPGRAYYYWDNLTGGAQEPRPLDRAPAWAEAGAEPPGGKRLAAVSQDFRDRIKEQTPDLTLGNMLADADNDKDRARARLTSECAVAGLAALGDLVRVAEALANPKHADARDMAATALRNWIAAEPGHDWQLFEVLVERLGYRPAQAETVVQLLHTPFAEDQPETFETLIAYLKHARLAVRQLAWWHLYRLAPAGRSIRYDPAGPEAEREKARAEWKKLVPTGKLPPRE